MSLPPFPDRPEDNSGIHDSQPEAFQPAPTNKRGKRGLAIAGATVLSLAVLAGGSFAAASVLNSMSDRDISVALPESTSAFIQADLDPSPGQKINLASVAGKIKDISGNTDYDPNKDPKQLFTDLFFSKLDYKTEVQPWVGDKVALGAWGDLSKAADDTVSGHASKDAKDANVVVVYEIKDKGKAEEAAKKLDSSKAVYEVTDHYLIIAANKATLDSYNTEIAKGTLDKNKTFNDDRKLLSGQDDIALSWIDASKLHADKALNSYMSKTLGSNANVKDKLSGRMIAGMSLGNNSVKVTGKFVGFDTSGITAEKGLSEVGNLPANTNVAIGFKDGQTAAKKAWDEYAADRGEYAISSMNDSLAQMGITLPDDFGALLGSETSFGVSLNENSKDTGANYRAKDGNLGKISHVIDSIDPSGSNITTKDDSGTVSVQYGKNGGGKLADAPAFKNVTGDLSNSQSVIFVDINTIMHEVRNARGGDKHPDTNYGAAGLTSVFDPSSKVVTVDVNWAF